MTGQIPASYTLARPARLFHTCDAWFCPVCVPRAARAADNRAHVRRLLAERDPEFAWLLARAAEML